MPKTDEEAGLINPQGPSLASRKIDVSQFYKMDFCLRVHLRNKNEEGDFLAR